MKLSGVQLKPGEYTRAYRESWGDGIFLVLHQETAGSPSPQARIYLRGVPIPVTLSSDDLEADDWEEVP